MSFIRVLPILLLLPILAMADDDKNFKIQPQQFKQGTVVQPVANTAVELAKGIAVSENPTFPLKQNTIYWRHKVSPKEYQWISGNVAIENFAKLHAFNLKDNFFKPSEVAKMRFYGSQNAKAFQDEPDLYFDREYIYSPRISKLFFVKNGHWQTLKESTLPGVIKFSSDNENASFSGSKGVVNSKQLFPVAPGAYSFVFTAPDCYPYADIGVVESGKAYVFKTAFTPYEIDTTKKAPVSVIPADVVAAQSLEELEIVNDKFFMELNAAMDTLNVKSFESVYPPIVAASTIGLMDDDSAYVEYVARYKNKKDEALKIWIRSQIGDVSALDKQIRSKLDSLEALPLRGSMMPAVVTPTFDTDSGALVPRVVSIDLKFGEDNGRFDFGWKGVVPGVDMDRLYVWLHERTPDVQVHLNLQNNKPVWIYKDGLVVARHQYRFIQIEFHVRDSVYVGEGNFVLPNYIYEQPEVQAWLSTPITAEPPQKDTTEADAVVDSAIVGPMPDIEDLIPAMRVIRDKVHGTVALLDSGSFRYMGRVVSMSPFAIMTTEVTQKFFAQTMNSMDSTKRIKDRSKFADPEKPVHNITWDDARAVCQALGGDLPSEAQWEFAARASNNEGFPWANDSVPNPDVYAVYKANSYDKGSKSGEYGPHKVASKKPNAWGIYDMAGNVAEWTRDKYFMFSFVVESSNPTGAMFGYSKVFKGGSWKDKEKRLNATYRDDEDPRYWSETMGFRCVYPREIIKE